MSIRRFTRLANAFSKKVENHAHAIALHFMYYNFRRIHQTLKITPAISVASAAGVTDRPWEPWDVVKVVKLVDDAEPERMPRGPYKPCLVISN